MADYTFNPKPTNQAPPKSPDGDGEGGPTIRGRDFQYWPRADGDGERPTGWKADGIASWRSGCDAKTGRLPVDSPGTRD